MNCTSGGEESSLPWNWVMESLAGVEDIDTAVLENLVKLVPHGYESLDPGAKERLALRGLFELSAKTNDADTTNVSSTSGLDIFDVAVSAQDVYNRILSKMQTSNLPDSLKLEIRQFAIQKKSHLPKCRLQQLEEALRDRGATSNEILREVLSVQLARNKECLKNGTEIQAPNVNHARSLSGDQENHLQEDFHAEPSNTSRKDGTVQILENSASVPSAQDVENISKQCRKVGVSQPVDEISSASPPKSLTDTVQVDHANDHLVTGKRKRCLFEKDPLLYSVDTDQVFVPEALESSHGRNILLVQSEAAAAQVQGIDGCECSSRRLRALADSPQTEDQEVTAEEACDKVQDPNAVKLTDKCQASVEDITAIQSSLVAQDSLEAEWTEENLCMKCNKGDQLLVCCVETCPIIIHEICLGSSTANFDTMGKFYCPLCSYSQALAAYHEAKEKAKRAKKKAVLMRDRLDEFLNLKNDPKKRKLSNMEAPKDTGNDHVESEGLGNEEPLLNPAPVNAPQTGHAIEIQQSSDSRRVIDQPESSSRPSYSDEFLNLKTDPKKRKVSNKEVPKDTGNDHVESEALGNEVLNPPPVNAPQTGHVIEIQQSSDSRRVIDPPESSGRPSYSDEFLNLKNDPKKRKVSNMEAPKDTGNDHVESETLGNEEPLLSPPPFNASQTGQAIEIQQSSDSRRVIDPPESSGRPSYSDEFLNLKNDPKKRKVSNMEAPKDTGNDHVESEALGDEEPLLNPPPVNAPQTGQAIEIQQSLESRRVIAPPESSGRPSFRIPPESLDCPLVTNAPRESSDCPLSNQAQESNANVSVQCQGAPKISKKPLVGLYVNEPKGPSHPLEKIVESHSAGTKTTITDEEVAAADVGAAARDLQQESTSSDQRSHEVSAQNDCNRGLIFRKRNTHPPLRQILTKTRRVPTKWTAAEVAMLEEGMKRFMNSPTKWNDILEFGGRVFNPCRMGGDLKDKWRNMNK